MRSAANRGEGVECRASAVSWGEIANTTHGSGLLPWSLIAVSEAPLQQRLKYQLSLGGAADTSLRLMAHWFRVARLPFCSCPIRELPPFSSNTLLILNQRIKIRAYLKYELGVIPKAFRNMEMKALGVL
jgi:hypothetical protein